MQIESLYKDIDFRSKVTRDELYELSDHLFERTLKPIKEVIKKAKVKRTDILECVLVGGGTRVKKIKDEIEAYIGRCVFAQAYTFANNMNASHGMV